MRKRIAALALIPLLAACTTDGYNVEPVVGPNDHRGVDVPDIDDEDAVKAQKCFRLSLWEDKAFDYDETNVGIACIVEEER